jgi:hypothetical protein
MYLDVPHPVAGEHVDDIVVHPVRPADEKGGHYESPEHTECG